MKKASDRILQRQQEAEVMDFLRQRAQEDQDQANGRSNRRVSLTLARENLFLEQFQEVASRVFAHKLVIPKYACKPSRGKTHRVLNVMISDTHFGSLLDSRECPIQYGAVEEARRLAAVCQQVAEYKRQYRAETELNIHLMGDLIHGKLHDVQDGAPLSLQMVAAKRLLIQAIGFLASQFPKGVNVYCTTGNHGRNTARHAQRATSAKWDSLETVIYDGIRTAVAHVPNVTVHIPRSQFYTFTAFNRKGFMTHGDGVLNAGYPSKAIDVRSIKTQADNINAAHKDHYSLFGIGHVHTGSLTHLPNKTIFLSNGALIPPDPYAVSLGILDTTCGQWIFESVEDHIVGDSRFVVVDEHTDGDAALDRIIQPFDPSRF